MTPDPIEQIAAWLKDEGFIDDKGVETTTPRHGSCCTCRDCGFKYDDCRCDVNRRNTEWSELVAALRQQREAGQPDLGMQAVALRQWASQIRLAEDQQTLIAIADDIDVNAFALEGADTVTVETATPWLLCPHCLHRWDRRGMPVDAWESCPSCHGRFTFVKPRAIGEPLRAEAQPEQERVARLRREALPGADDDELAQIEGWNSALDAVSLALKSSCACGASWVANDARLPCPECGAKS